MNSIYHKIHRIAGEQAVLAVCDKELAGKTLRDGAIEFRVNEKFYRGAPLGEEELKKLLHEFDNINLVGNKAVGIAEKEKLIMPESAIRIQGIKHAQIFRV